MTPLDEVPSALVRALGLTYPMLQAPVGSAASPALAVAVARAGALGALSGTWQAPASAAAQVEHVQAELSGHPFQVNFVLAFPPLALAAVLAAGAPVVTFSWGDAAPYLETVRRAGARVGVQVTNAAGADRMAAAGVDFLVCQGTEAGGHVQSTTSLWNLLGRVIDAARGVPVVAAGGIACGEHIARALDAGAAGAVLGTRFVATQECDAHPLYKQRLVTATAADTALTTCFDGGWPGAAHRVLRNATLEAWEAAGSPPPGHRPGESDVVAETPDRLAVRRYDDATPRAGMTGEVLAMALYAGAGCGVIADLPPAGLLVRRLWDECRRARGAR